MGLRNKTSAAKEAVQWRGKLVRICIKEEKPVWGRRVLADCTGTEDVLNLLNKTKAQIYRYLAILV